MTKVIFTGQHLWRRMVLLVLMLGVHPASADQILPEMSHQVLLDGYIYRYDSVPVLKPNSHDVDGYVGHIIVSDSKTGEMRYEQNTSLRPDCDKLPAVSVLRPSKMPPALLSDTNPALILFCGSDSGRQNSLQILYDGAADIVSASLDFYDSDQNIAWDDAAGAFVSLVRRRFVFEGDQGSESHAFLYRLTFDDSTIGFTPIFGSWTAKYYKKYYADELHNWGIAQVAERPGQAITDLVATEDTTFIYAEIARLKQHGARQEDIEDWIQIAPAAGYPRFDLQRCKSDH